MHFLEIVFCDCSMFCLCGHGVAFILWRLCFLIVPIQAWGFAAQVCASGFFLSSCLLILAVTHHLNRKQKSICNPTVASLNRRLLHTDAFTHRHFYTRKGCDGHLKIAILRSVFDVQRPFRAKGLRWTN